MTLLVLSFLGIVLGVALWCMWCACLTTTCISSLHVVYGVGAAFDGQWLVGAIFGYFGTLFLCLMWVAESQLQAARGEPPTQ